MRPTGARSVPLSVRGHTELPLQTLRARNSSRPGSDKNDGPDFADPRFGLEVYGCYDVTTYW